jgi:hypothetical protein
MNVTKRSPSKVTEIVVNVAIVFQSQGGIDGACRPSLSVALSAIYFLTTQ